MRQEPLEILAPVLPCGQGGLSRAGGPSAFSTSFFQTAACSASFGFVWQRNCTSRKFTSFREDFSHNENYVIRAAYTAGRNTHPEVDRFGSKRLRRFGLQSREQAVHETLAPWHRTVLAVVFVSHICLFTLSEDLHQNAAGVRLRYPKGKGSLIFCQALFLEIRIFGQFFA
jgi:hypothetical protein